MSLSDAIPPEPNTKGYIAIVRCANRSRETFRFTLIQLCEWRLSCEIVRRAHLVLTLGDGQSHPT